MEARLLKWKERSDNNIALANELEKFRLESIKREAEKRQAEKIEKLLQAVPPRFRGKTFSDYRAETPEQIRTRIIAEKFVATFPDRLSDGTVLRFLGNVGAGKTFLSLVMYQSIVKMGFTAQYESTTQFLKILQEKRFESNAAYQALLNHYKNIQFLILDEITESFTKDGQLAEIERATLFDLVNARYETGKCCTLIISNRDKSELASRLGSRVYDRLSEKSITLIFNWKSYRQN